MDSLNKGINSIHKKVNLIVSYSHFFRNQSNNIEFPKNKNKLMIDSGAYDLLVRGKNDEFPFSAKEYADAVKNLVPKPDYVVSMDYICAPEENNDNLNLINKTIDNAEILRKEFKRGDDFCFIPVIQGYYKDEYIYCIKELIKKKIVQNGDYIGIGSLAARKKVKEPREIIKSIYYYLKKKDINVNIHGFGLNLNIIKEEETFNILSSFDSLAWIFPYRFGRVKVFTRERLIEANSNGSLIEPEFYFLSLNASLKYIEFLNRRFRYGYRKLSRSLERNKKNETELFSAIAQKFGIDAVHSKKIKNRKDLYNIIKLQIDKFPREFDLFIKRIPVYTGHKFLLLDPKNVKIGKIEFLYSLLSALDFAHTDYLNTEGGDFNEMFDLFQAFYSSFKKTEMKAIEKAFDEINCQNQFDVLHQYKTRFSQAEYFEILNSLINKLELKLFKLRIPSPHKQLDLQGNIVRKNCFFLIDDFNL